MEMLVNHPDFDIHQLAEQLANAAREGVKWERRELEWILEEKKMSEAVNESAA